MKQFAVLGLGRFGKSMAKTLAELGNQVMAIDYTEEKINAIADVVSQAYICDITNKEALRSLGINAVDVAIISIASNFEASILATIICKDFGIPRVIAKAKTSMHAEILKKIGADEVVVPEKDMAFKMAHNLTNSNFVDLFAITKKHTIVEIKAPKVWYDKQIDQIDVRKKYGVNVLGLLRENGDFVGNPKPSDSIKENDIVVMLGTNEQFMKIRELDQ